MNEPPSPRPVWLVDEVEYTSLADALMAAGRRAAQTLANLSEHLQKAGLIPEQPPAEPRARALWLRQHRGTGPAATRHTKRSNW